MDEQLSDIKTKMNQKVPTKILESFHKLVIDENSSLIMLEISKRLREECAKQIVDPENRRDKLIEDNQK